MKIKGGKYNHLKAPRYPDLVLMPGLESGLERLVAAPMTINGITVAPSVTLVATDVVVLADGWTSRAAAETWTKAGADPTPQVEAPFYSDEKGLKQNAGYWTNGGVVSADVALEDLVVEIVHTHVSENTYLVSKGPNPGWCCRLTGGPAYANIGGSVNIACGGSPAANGLYHDIWFMRRASTGTGYSNGVAGLSQSIVTQAGSQSNAGVLWIGASGGVFQTTCTLYSIQIWKREAWLDTSAQTEIAQQRFAILEASKPKYSKYSIPRPTSSGTTVAAHQTKRLDDGTTRLFQVGANVPRFEKGVDLAGTPYVGAIVEGVTENFLLQSNTWLTTWIRRGIATVVENTSETTDPRGELHAMKVTGIGEISVNDIYQACVGYVAGTQLTNGIWIKRISVSGILGIGHPTTSGGPWLINLASLPDKWVRITRASPYVSVATKMTVSAAGMVGQHFFAATGAPLSFYAFNTQQHYGTMVGEDLITTTAAGSKPADYQPYPIVEGHEIGVGVGSMYVKYYAPSFVPTSQLYFGSLNDGTTNNQIVIYIDTDGCCKGLTRKTAGTDGDVVGAINKCDGYIHECLLCWTTGRLWIINDGVVSAEDNTLDIPTGLNTFSLGSNVTPAYHSGPIRVIDLKTWKRIIDWSERIL